MGQKERERFGSLVSGARECVEPLIRFGLEKYGFVRVENKGEARDIRLDVQRAFWALSGQDYLLDLPQQLHQKTEQIGVVPQGLLEFKWMIDEDSWRNLPDQRERKVIESIMAVSSRKELLSTVLGEAFSFSLPSETIFSARRRLENMLEVIGHQEEKHRKGKRAMILTQTAYLLGGEGKRHLPYGFDPWFEFGLTVGGGTLPYLGTAVVYSELMGTGKFGEIEIADFRDTEVISRLIENREKYDLVLISGATTYDTFLIRDLNMKLSANGLTAINGGIAATISTNPQRFLTDGVSLFIGEFEGAAEAVLERLASDRSPTVFVRGENNAKGKRLKKGGTNVTFLDGLPEKADMKEAYSPERERKGYLKNRLEALVSMRQTAKFGGVEYEPPPLLRPHETNVSYGCPNACVFCATVSHQGREMRERTVLSIAQEWQAVEAPIIAIVDQNLTANGRRFFESLLGLAERLGKRVAFEGELSFFRPNTDRFCDDNFFFDGSEDDRERERLLKKTVIGLTVGLEQPYKVKGSDQGRKDPRDFTASLKKLNDLGLITFGTAMIGLPKELWSSEVKDDEELTIIPLERMTLDEWEKMLSYWTDWFENIVPTPGPVPFAFTVISGTAAYKILAEKGMLRFLGDGLIQRKETEDDLIVSLNPNLVIGINSRGAVEDLRRHLYSRRSTVKRLRAAKLSPRKLMFMLFFNMAAGIVIRDKML